MTESCWNIVGQKASLELPSLSGVISLSKPAGGLHNLKIEDDSLARLAILGIGLTTEAEEEVSTAPESYARCSDLVAIYGETSVQPFRTIVYWRTDSHPRECEDFTAIAAIELVASRQTPLLESHPTVLSGSLIPCVEVFNMTDSDQGTFEQVSIGPGDLLGLDPPEDVGCLVLRLPGGRWSYAEMVHPANFDGSHLIGAKQTVHTKHTLFRRDLEKGVVLRSRLLGLILPRSNDTLAAAAHYRAWATSEIPLTT